ncbi:unnamed protein product [Nippostrongylus brasiliensis]|uniref:DNA polymerase eta n=1 Tax=Nippostrongylus brasiliensis TaxID=27835 RepID=A0A0N4YLF2_NIPBR|nr:unnamed protein product [Nippostrongylus brasiliensis]
MSLPSQKNLVPNYPALEVIAICHFSYGDDLLNCSPEGVQSRVDVLVSCGISAGKGCGRVVSRCPAVLFARDPKEMSGVSEALCGFFSRKEVTAIVQITPEVLLKNIEDLEEKYEYIFFQVKFTPHYVCVRELTPVNQMCIEGEQFKECAKWAVMSLDEIMTRHEFLLKTGRSCEQFKECAKWAVMSLDEIMTRHEFLLKTGRYTTPDPKHPQKKMGDPGLPDCLCFLSERSISEQCRKETNISYSLIIRLQVAGVSREEWTVYRAFSERLSGRSGDEDRPYERVKPSKRKAFERRRKEGQVVANHVFDVAALQSN